MGWGMGQSLLGLVCFVLLAWAVSENRRAVNFHIIAAGLGIQLALAFLLFKLPFMQEIFVWLNKLVLVLASATDAGTGFVFGYLGGGELPFVPKEGANTTILAFKALPLLLVMSALTSTLFYWRVLPYIVLGFSWILQKILRIGGALGLAAAANVFVGMTEAPLFIRPYLKDMTRSELFALMSCGMATIAGTVMVLYAAMLGSVIPGVLGHLLVASVLNAPAALIISQLMVPETEKTTTGSNFPPQQAKSTLDAVTIGTLDGLHLWLNIIAMLLVFVALVFLINLCLGVLPDVAGAPITLERIFGIVMAPFMWLLGIPWSEAHTAGMLMGTKTVLNEFIAYLTMAQLPEGALSPRSQLIMTYAMCGFANFSSVGIMIGGLGTLAPERRDEIAQLGLRAILAGTLATCMTGALVGLFH